MNLTSQRFPVIDRSPIIQYSTKSLSQEPRFFLPKTAKFTLMPGVPLLREFLNRAFCIERIRPTWTVINFWFGSWKIDTLTILHSSNAKKAIVQLEKHLKAVFRCFDAIRSSESASWPSKTYYAQFLCIMHMHHVMHFFIPKKTVRITDNRFV
jgi:hypothetical protein